MRLLRQYISRYKGLHRVALSGRTRLAAVLAVCALTIGGGAFAVGAADAAPRTTVNLQGYVLACTKAGYWPKHVDVYSLRKLGAADLDGHFYNIDISNIPSFGEGIYGVITCGPVTGRGKSYTAVSQVFWMPAPKTWYYQHNLDLQR